MRNEVISSSKQGNALHRFLGSLQVKHQVNVFLVVVYGRAYSLSDNLLPWYLAAGSLHRQASGWS